MDEAIVNLSKHRIEQAKQCVKSAKILVAADDYYAISKKEVEEQILNAELFCKTIEDYVAAKYTED